MLERVRFTTLPNGISGAGPTGGAILRVSVFVTPEVVANGDAELAQRTTDHGFKDWPTKAEGLQFTINFESVINGQTSGKVSAKVASTKKLNQALWDALFRNVPAAPVRKGSFAAASAQGLTAGNINIRSFSATEVHNSLRNWYGDAASKSLPDSEPRVAGIFGTQQEPVRFSGVPTLSDVAGTDSFGLLSSTQTALDATRSRELATFKELFDFHYRSPSTINTLNRVEPEPPDFHEFVSCLGEYPALMRESGLVIDLEIPLQNIPQVPLTAAGAEATDLLIWVDAQVPNVEVLPPPKTRYVLSLNTTQFHAAPRRVLPEIKNGLLAIDDEKSYSVIQLDVDGAGLKAIEFANNIDRIQTTKALDAPHEKAPPPSLRTSGISLMKRSRDAQVKTWLSEAKAMSLRGETPETILLSAEDLVRGYRLDVHDGRRWFSLCERHIEFSVAGVPLPPVDDEGWVSFVVTQRPDRNGNNEALIHESLIHWTGWGLCAPRPGEAFDAPPDSINRPLQSTVTIGRGRLPVLRYGKSYRLRVRVADLAGNGVKFQASEITGPVAPAAASGFPYRRFEPLGSPLLLPRENLNPEPSVIPTRPGETLNRLVIRSNFDQSTRNYARVFRRDHRDYREESDRHIVPPKTSIETATLHGKLDTDQGVPDKDSYEVLVDKDQEFRTNAVYDDKELELIYLPDPLVQSAAFYGLPSTSGIWLAPFLGDWPDLEPFRIVLNEGGGPPKWDERDHVLNVYLPKGQVAHVMLSCAFTLQSELFEAGAQANAAPPADLKRLEQMAVWDWMKSRRMQRIGVATADDFASRMALGGRVGMLSPSRELILVHAVQQPLAAPVVSPNFSSRKTGLNQTNSEVTGEILLDSASTSKVELMAQWNDQIDDLLQPGPTRIAGRTSILEHNLKHPFQPPLETNPVALRAAAEPVCEPEETQLNVLSLPKKQDSCAGLHHEFGDTRHRDVIYYAVGTTRFLEQFLTENEIERGDGTGDRFKRESPPVSRAPVCIRNSARPDQPKVLYVIPTFGWAPVQRNENRMTKTRSAQHERKGGGLRVYLERPWFSSGDQELLGVVLWPGVDGTGLSSTSQDVPSTLKPYVSQWGMDPLWDSTQLREPLAKKHFVNVAQISTGPCSLDQPDRYTLGELSTAPTYPKEHLVTVVPFKPEYDPSRQLWYCDIIMQSPDTYFPFVRLALTRFQPFSVRERAGDEIKADCHISAVVLADFVQLAPGRTVSISYPSKKPKRVCISVQGVSYQRSSAGTDGNEIEVSLEERDEHIESSWRPVPGKVVRLLKVAAPPCEIPATTPSGRTETIWAGEISSETELKREKFRLVFREYETFIDDNEQRVRRIVFADALQL